MPKEARMVSDTDLKKLDWAEKFFEQHRPGIHVKRHIVILTRMGYIGTKHNISQEAIIRIKEFLERENIEYVEEIKINRCQLAHDITEDILHEQCKTEDDKCKIAKEISEDIVSRECDDHPLLWLLARVVDLPEEDIAFSEYDSYNNKITITYGVGKPQEQKRIVTKKAPQDFIEFWKPYFDAPYERKVEAIKKYLKGDTFDREDIDDAFYNFLQKDLEEAGYYVEYVNEDSNYMYFKLIDKKTNKKSRIIELSNDRLCKEVSAGRSKYLAREVIKEL